TEQESRAGEDEGGRKALQHLVEHRPVEREGAAEIALKQVAEPDDILLEEGLVETELSIETGDVVGRGEVTEDSGRRVARYQRHHQEDDQREPEQDRNGRQKPLYDVACHDGRAPVAARNARLRRRGAGGRPVSSS